MGGREICIKSRTRGPKRGKGGRELAFALDPKGDRTAYRYAYSPTGRGAGKGP